VKRREEIVSRRQGTVKNVSAAVLAGGRSRRMGKDKAFVEIRGKTMLARVLERLSPLFERIMIVGPASPALEDFEFPVYPDLRPGKGSLGGIHTALHYSPTEEIFCTACDLPFINPAVVSHILRLAGGGWQAVVPVVDGEMEPLCALYSRSMAGAVERDLDAGVRRIKTTLASLRVRVVEAEELLPMDPELLTFFNINTPADLERARAIATSEGT
jgi:molybdopterin-guanine dinucleotide biosynthesis protein A